MESCRSATWGQVFQETYLNPFSFENTKAAWNSSEQGSRCGRIFCAVMKDLFIANPRKLIYENIRHITTNSKNYSLDKKIVEGLAVLLGVINTLALYAAGGFLALIALDVVICLLMVSCVILYVLLQLLLLLVKP